MFSQKHLWTIFSILGLGKAVISAAQSLLSIVYVTCTSLRDHVYVRTNYDVSRLTATDPKIVDFWKAALDLWTMRCMPARHDVGLEMDNRQHS